MGNILTLALATALKQPMPLPNIPSKISFQLHQGRISSSKSFGERSFFPVILKNLLLFFLIKNVELSFYLVPKWISKNMCRFRDSSRLKKHEF